MHLETQKKKSGVYYYLAETLRLKGGRWRKTRIYLGKNLSKKELDTMKKKKAGELNKKTLSDRKKFDPLSGLISPEVIGKLENLRRSFKKKRAKMDYFEYKNFYESFVTEFTYDTNAIEGSTLTLKETGMILFDKIVPEGKTIREINEVQNHKDAFDYMISYKGEINRKFVLKLHKLLMHNILWKYAGVFRDVQVYVRGANFMPTKPEHVEDEFKKMTLWYRSNKKKYNPVILAACFHHMFESIHPFRDGNGRVGRLLLNFVLRKSGFPMINIKYKNRSKYYDALEKANLGDSRPLVDLVAEYLLEVETAEKSI